MTTTLETIATVEQFNVTARSTTKTVTTHTANASLDLGDFTFTLFGTPKMLDYIFVHASWTSDKKAPTAADWNTSVTIHYYSVLSNGKKGSKYEKRDMSIASLRDYTNLPAAAIDALVDRFDFQASEVAK